MKTRREPLTKATTMTTCLADKSGNQFQFRHYATVEVRLNGRKVGTIKPIMDGFHYVPVGQKAGGDVFPTVEACKQSIVNG